MCICNLLGSFDWWTDFSGLSCRLFMSTSVNSQNRYPKLGHDNSPSSSSVRTLTCYLTLVGSGTVFVASTTYLISCLYWFYDSKMSWTTWSSWTWFELRTELCELQKSLPTDKIPFYSWLPPLFNPQAYLIWESESLFKQESLVLKESSALKI